MGNIATYIVLFIGIIIIYFQIRLFYITRIRQKWFDEDCNTTGKCYHDFRIRKITMAKMIFKNPFRWRWPEMETYGFDS